MTPPMRRITLPLIAELGLTLGFTYGLSITVWF